MPPPTPKFAFAPDGVPVIQPPPVTKSAGVHPGGGGGGGVRSEEHTSELQSQSNLVCRLLPEKKNPRSGALHPRAVRRSHQERNRQVHQDRQGSRDHGRVNSIAPARRAFSGRFLRSVS